MTGRARAWRALNLAVTILSLGFLAWAISATGALADPAWRDPRLLGALAAAGCLYGTALLLVVAGWLALVRGASPCHQALPARLALHIYGPSQLYKYLPSNVLHYVGRHAALRRAGIGHLPASVGGLGEIALLIVAALTVAAIAAHVGENPLSERLALPIPTTLAIIAMATAGAAIACAVLMRFPRTAQLLRSLRPGRLLRAAAIALSAYVLFFLCSGVAFVVLAAASGPWGSGDAALLVAIWSAAWALGFVTPGAPGGIGVREAMLLAGLAPVAGFESAALTALAMRLATILGDLMLALSAFLLGAPGERSYTTSPL